MPVEPYFPVLHRTTKIDGVEIFYREAGARDAPAVVLLHGFPSSSHMFRNVIPALAQSHWVVAPDFPGFGLSDSPDRGKFSYTFENIASIIAKFIDQIGVKHYALYVMDYGAPVGFRISLQHQTRVAALMIQNGNAYEDGLQSFWEPLKAYWASPTDEKRNALRELLKPEATRFQYVDGVVDVERLDPAAWIHDQVFLDRPGNDEIQLDLLYDYRNNVALYPKFQDCFRYHQPPTLIMWGQNDQIFPPEGAKAFLRDIPYADLNLLDTGHFALEDKADVMVPMMLDFLSRVHLPRH